MSCSNGDRWNPERAESKTKELWESLLLIFIYLSWNVQYSYIMKGDIITRYSDQ